MTITEKFAALTIGTRVNVSERFRGKDITLTGTIVGCETIGRKVIFHIKYDHSEEYEKLTRWQGKKEIDSLTII